MFGQLDLKICTLFSIDDAMTIIKKRQIEQHIKFGELFKNLEPIQSKKRQISVYSLDLDDIDIRASSKSVLSKNK